MKTRIVRATAGDVPVILSLIRGLAEYEKLSAEVTATEEGLRASLFGRDKGADVLLAYDGETPVGFAVYFQNYSTFLGRPGLYLEDLFVRPALRSHGIGRALLRALARIARDRDCGRMEWAVLDWNEPALKFYKSLDARQMNEWIIHRLTPVEIGKLAAET